MNSIGQYLLPSPSQGLRIHKNICSDNCKLCRKKFDPIIETVHHSALLDEIILSIGGDMEGMWQLMGIFHILFRSLSCLYQFFLNKNLHLKLHTVTCVFRMFPYTLFVVFF